MECSLHDTVMTKHLFCLPAASLATFAGNSVVRPPGPLAEISVVAEARVPSAKEVA